MAAKYEYYLDFGSGNVEIIPDKDAVFKWEKENKNEGFKRRKLQTLAFSKDYDNQGTLTNATPFNTLWEWFFDSTKYKTEIKLLIYKNSVLDFESLFYIGTGDIDVNSGVYVIKPIVDDPYKELLKVAGDKVDVITGSNDVYAAQYSYTTETEQEDSESMTVPPTTEPTMGNYDGGTSWTRAVEEYGEYTTIWTRERSQYELTAAPFHDWVLWEDWWYLKTIYPQTKEWDFPNCFLLTDIIQEILDKILFGSGTSLTFVSNFFNDETNYVTLEENFLMNTLVEQRSDTKDPAATNKATKGEMTFNELMNDLKSIFEVSWFIDGTDLRIEHEKYFTNGASFGSKTVGIDLTNSGKYVADEADKYYVENTQSFTGNDGDAVSGDTINFQDEFSEDFISAEFYIEFDIISTTASKREHHVTIFATDVPTAMQSPDDLGDDGFFMFNCEPLISGVSQIITRPRQVVLPIPEVLVVNAAFSTKWLLHDYYEYNRENRSGQLHVPAGHQGAPGTAYSVLSIRNSYLQKDIIFLLNDLDMIDVNKYIRTYLIKSDGSKYNNDGNIEKIEHDLSDDFVKVTLGYTL